MIDLAIITAILARDRVAAGVAVGPKPAVV
jgi:hypothetical protein